MTRQQNMALLNERSALTTQARRDSRQALNDKDPALAHLPGSYLAFVGHEGASIVSFFARRTLTIAAFVVTDACATR